MKNRFKTIKKALVSINRYHKKYGFATAFRVIIHFSYRTLRHFQLNSSNSIRINDYTMFVNPNDPGVSTELSIFKIHEPLNTQILSKLLTKGMTCLDIGGNIGYYVLLERKLVGDEGKIIAIEPLQENFQYLQKNIQLQNFSNISTYNFALGDKNGKATFVIEKQKNNSWVLPEGKPPPPPSLGTLCEVPIRMSDQFIDELKLERLDFIRMDVEGFELHILGSLKNTIQKFKPIISLELHKGILGYDDTSKFFKLMKEHGYQIESCVQRDLDIPLIGTLKDIKKPTIDELLVMIGDGKVGNFLMLNFIHHSKIHSDLD
jgi:FkbM family methyltransferase